MIYVGIDIAKLDHFASAVDSDAEVLIEPFKFTNDADGFHMLSAKLESLPTGERIIIGLESTAHYGNNLVRYLVSCSYDVCVLNPIQTAILRKSNIRKTKTNKVGTFIICQALMLQKSYRFVSFDDLVLCLAASARSRPSREPGLSSSSKLTSIRLSLNFSISLSQGCTKRVSTHCSGKHLLPGTSLPCI